MDREDFLFPVVQTPKLIDLVVSENNVSKISGLYQTSLYSLFFIDNRCKIQAIPVLVDGVKHR